LDRGSACRIGLYLYKSTPGNKAGIVRILVNVTSKRFLVTIVVVENQEVLYILNVCLYSARKAHAPYCLCGLSGSATFVHVTL